MWTPQGTPILNLDFFLPSPPPKKKKQWKKYEVIFDMHRYQKRASQDHIYQKTLKQN